jgi:hypothetical protein
MLAANNERAAIEVVLDQYMQAMDDKDVERAYALFSERARRQVPIGKLQELVEGSNYLIFEGYQSLKVQNIRLMATVNTNPDMPQGDVAQVDGVVNFEGGIQGTFNGTLEKADGRWQIHGVFVNVPPTKIKP